MRLLDVHAWLLLSLLADNNGLTRGAAALVRDDRKITVIGKGDLRPTLNIYTSAGAQLASIPVRVAALCAAAAVRCSLCSARHPRARLLSPLTSFAVRVGSGGLGGW
eukprot:1878851-Rhodomonas_salina.2